MLHFEKRQVAYICEGYKKRKLNIIFKFSNNISVSLLKFLTLNKLIYGFSVFYKKNICVFLKYPLNNQKQSLIKLLHDGGARRYFLNFIFVKKSFRYHKNSNYVYKTRMGYFTLKGLLLFKIGGKLLLKY